MAPINEKTLVDQETGYSSLSEATPLKEHKSSWRRSGVAAAVLSALALGAVAAIKTTSPMRGSKNTAFYPKATIENGRSCQFRARSTTLGMACFATLTPTLSKSGATCGQPRVAAAASSPKSPPQ